MDNDRKVLREIKRLSDESSSQFFWSLMFTAIIVGGYFWASPGKDDIKQIVIEHCSMNSQVIKEKE